MKIAILGAECTGKTQLAQALVHQLQTRYPRTTWVPEYLRTWCDTQGRTPRADEQRAIAQVQMDLVRAQAASNMVVCDTAPLMTAVYSDVIFGDTSLYEFAVAQHCHFGLTLVTGLDLAWVSDGIQRDGEAVRCRVDHRLREVLAQHGIGFSAVYGTGEARAHNALQVIDYALGTARPASQVSAWKWGCDTCSDADCEHRMFSALMGP